MEETQPHAAARRLTASLGPVVTLPGLPDGVVCRSVQPVERQDDGWRIVRDRRRHLRLDEVALCAPGAPAVAVVPVAASVHRRFVLGAGRRAWSAVSQRVGAGAWDLALELVRAGVVTIVCKAGDELQLGLPLRWHLTEAGADLADALAGELAQHRDVNDRELARVVAELEATQADLPAYAADGADGGSLSGAAVGTLLDALRRCAAGSTQEVLLAVSRDVLGGVRHDSPRAFSLAHFADSKERDDVASRLADAGVDPNVARALGILRAPRLGVAGQVQVCTQSRHGAEPSCKDTGWEVSTLTGPTLLRTDTTDLHLHLTGRDVVVLENLQAAEAVDELRRRQDLPLAVLYCAGVPGGGARQLISQLAQQVPAGDGQVLLCPDADFGGVRIAEAIADVLSPSARTFTRISDIGAWPHRPQRPWPAGSESRRGLTAALGGAAGHLARACLDRGYRVEQEQAIVTAVRSWLERNTCGTFALASSEMSDASPTVAP